MKTIHYRTIIKVFMVLPFYLFASLPLSAQTFTQRIQKEVPGKGTVTIHEDPAIDELVNTTVLPTERATKPEKPATKNDKPERTERTEKPDKPEKPATATTVTTTPQDEDPEADPTKKVIRGGHKITGYRVQAFAGGNSRKDRQQAEQIGNNIRLQFPGVPVYVHFYSPRWICRVGNYRTYEEAHQMLNSLRSMGYSEASIVKGKITVAY